MNLNELRTRYRNDIIAIMDKYGAENVRVFGSVVKGGMREDSDIDFLVHLRPGTSLFDLGGMRYELIDLLHREVDIVSEKAVSPRLKDTIFSQATAL